MKICLQKFQFVRSFITYNLFTSYFRNRPQILLRLSILTLLYPEMATEHIGGAFSAELPWMQLRACAGLGSASFDSFPVKELWADCLQTVYPYGGKPFADMHAVLACD